MVNGLVGFSVAGLRCFSVLPLTESFTVIVDISAPCLVVLIGDLLGEEADAPALVTVAVSVGLVFSMVVA